MKALTGAVEESAKRKFGAANGGTIVWDKMGEITPALQAKLLQVTH
ncbi:sigma 54-interacting transcriptional regulator [Lihuaxuella thermophila]|nr:sigma 54-interacting transcriptional regulator [Lihuaxuella thermophila]